jgi:hypothetical protein
MEWRETRGPEIGLGGKRGFGGHLGVDGGDRGDIGADPRFDYRMASRLCQSNFFQYGKVALNKK